MAEAIEDPPENSESQVFLKKVAVLAPLDHKKSSSEQTAATDISPVLVSDTTETSAVKTIPIIHNILFFERFTCTVPEHFICLLCSNIVLDPRECSLCENLFCFLCIKTIGTCPMGCLNSNFNKIAKFALKTYNSLSLTCKYSTFGCNFQGILERVLEHEAKCEFFVVLCENSLCDRLIYRPSTQDPECPLLCSELCENIIKFSVMIQEENIRDSLNVFNTFFERCKKLAEIEVKEELQEKLRKIEENRRINEIFRRQKERLEKEIISRQSNFHPGQWNVRALKWTCCGIVEFTSIGCKHLGY
jgi:hypothetical protein